MENIFDLQIQSTASDGRHAPAEIVGMARDLGLSVIALTDHDTVAGVDEALAAGQKHGVRVIPGIEISVEEYGAHILGYGIDHKNEELLKRLSQCARDRMEGAKQMVENLKAAGFMIEWDDVAAQATGDVVARPHLARAVLSRPENKEKLGSITTSHDFIEKYLTDENPIYVRRTHISARDAIALIHGAGGVAVWSHPALHFRSDPEGLEKFLQELIAWGIEGIEVFNPSQTEDDAEFLQGLAVKYRLLRTAGSDFHEAGDHTADPTSGLHAARTLGDYEIHGFAIEDILPRLDDAIRQRQERAP
ncbi:MAG: PHP domain-containing protein [Candidatus Sungiibacteriota bacterium]